jgi:ubiquinol-cytochrome c reductase iron-sulfur subunit
VAESSAVEPTRRDFLFVATSGLGVVAAGAVAWPLIDQMNPDATVAALASIEVEVDAIEVGQAITVKWRGKPVFIRRRTEAEIEAARAVPLDDLPDRSAENQMLPADAPATDENRAAPGNEEWLVLVGVCTHLGCVPKGQSIGDARGEYGGWFCPCHGSHYDTAGRIRKGPAPRNLAVPPFEFVGDTTVRIG